MKKIYIKIFISVFALLACMSCEAFLDKSPDLGLDEQEIYKDYASISGYLDNIYGEYLSNHMGAYGTSNGRNFLGAISDELATMFNDAQVMQVHSGNWLKSGTNETFEIGNDKKTPIGSSYKALRAMNRIIENYNNIENLTEEQFQQIKGQAHFYRAWFYFQLIIRYGGMPIFDKVFVGDGDEDIPRKTYHESHDWMMEDIETAIESLPEFWEDKDTGRPTKAAAMAFKVMAQLYDASPLMQNDLNSVTVKDYDKERAALAAKSADELLKYLDEYPRNGGTPLYNYRMVSKEEYKNIFYFKRGNGSPWIHPEHLWYKRSVIDRISLTMRIFWLPVYLDGYTGPDGASYYAPTQNMVNLYERKGPDGNYYPIDDDRSGYDLQDPFADRDPRFYNNIIYPGQVWGENKGAPIYITTYEGGEIYKEAISNQNSNKRGQTGYMCKKYLWPEANCFTEQWEDYHFINVYIRVAQVYLDYAEASFEATGSATAKVAGCSLSAEDALNIVRNRVGVTDIASDIVSDPEKFREAVRRERTVELMFENHRWFDIRRWMIAHELFNSANPIKGIKAVPDHLPDPNNSTNPDNASLTYTYEEVNVVQEVRNFDMRNYWYPFTIKEVAAVKSLVQNPGW